LSAVREHRQVTAAVETASHARSAPTLFAPRFRRAFYAAAIAASLLLVAFVSWRGLSHKAKTPDGEIASGARGVSDASASSSGPVVEQSHDGARSTAPDGRVTKDRSVGDIATVSGSPQRRPKDSRSPLRPHTNSPAEALPISFRVDGGRVTAPALSNAQAGDAGANEVALSDFVPLGAAGHAAPLESGEVVRVEVTRAALASLGLPVNVSRASETVKADVLLAHDGTARAIRLVQ
ncbi:MAG: hypothetical protein M3268_06145, partial [Acidobacteriota bacterium]|nr:hypothetical protein [Acidobacteriota bacterium]